MKTALWLAWRELSRRRRRFLAAIAMVALPVAFCVGLELASSAREQAAAAQMDHMGPPIRLVPRGVGAFDASRFDFGGRELSQRLVTQLERELSAWVRAVDGRLLLKETVNGMEAPIIGIDPESVVTPFEALRELRHDEVAVGATLAHSLDLGAGQTVMLRSQRLEVAAVLAETGAVDDVAVFVPLQRAQHIAGRAGAVNAISLFPRPGASMDDLNAYLGANHADLGIIRTPRSDEGEYQTLETLRRYRMALYVVTVLIAALSLGAVAYLNAGERRLEMATLYAIGGSGRAVSATLAVRAAIVGALGSIAGYGLGAFIALVQDFQAAYSVVWSTPLFFSVVGGSVVLSVFVASPVAIAAAHRDHATVLQET